jgi:hypothetical protein
MNLCEHREVIEKVLESTWNRIGQKEQVPWDSNV